ncbi:MAG: DMT family transporter [Alphaproteobacteria bacterium]|nr:DMT family transporter [Alphaproteobacteria bacterium]
MSYVARGSDSVGRGIASVLVAVFCFTVADATGKVLGMAGYSAPQIVFLRYVFGLIPVAILIWSAGIVSLHTTRPFAHALRAILLFAALVSLFTSLRSLPLAEAISIVFTAPLFIAAFSYPILKEHVGARRWAAVAIGFLGALIMLQPGTEVFQVEALWALAAAIFFAFAMLFTRRLSATETTAAIFTYSTVGAGLVSIPFVLATWKTPLAGDLWQFGLIGVIGGIAAYLMIVAYRNAAAAIVAPFEFTALVWGALFGWILWGEQPAMRVWIGALVIGLCGLYITRREAKAQAVDPPM